MDKGCFFLAGIREDSLLQAVATATAMQRDNADGLPVPDYIDENVSGKAVRIVQSYVEIVNRMVWRKRIQDW